MTKKKSHSEIEFLRGEVRQLKAEIKRLKKDTSRKDKREHLYEDLEDLQAEAFLSEEVEERAEISKNMKCPKCKSALDTINEGGAIVIYVCPDCSYKCSKRTSNG